jgi:hypothetical protein
MRIVLPYACFGAVFSDRTGKCIEVAPIGSWMRGKGHGEIARWAESKGGTVERLW